MRSTLPRASRFLYSGGVFGLFVRKGSMTITLPPGVVTFIDVWPSHCTSSLPLLSCAVLGFAQPACNSNAAVRATTLRRTGFIQSSAVALLRRLLGSLSCHVVPDLRRVSDDG